MKDPKTQYSELVNLCKLYLLQEHSTTDWKLSDPETVAYFRKNPLKTTIPKPTASLIPPPSVQTIPPRPIVSHRTVMSKSPKPQMPQPNVQAEVPSSPEPWKLEPMGNANQIDTNSFKNILEGHIDNLPILETIPDDTKAKELQNKWRMPRAIPPVAIISFDESPRYRTFLGNIAKAISQIMLSEVIPLHVFDPNASTLRLVIATEQGLDRQENLKKLYRETHKGERTLGKVPLILLSELSLYFKEPHLKAALWEEIRRKIL